MTPEQVRDYNGLQVRKSCRWVFAPEDDFELAREICAAEPEVRDPARPRVRAGSTPIIDDGEKKRNYSYIIVLE